MSCGKIKGWQLLSYNHINVIPIWCFEVLKTLHCISTPLFFFLFASFFHGHLLRCYNFGWICIIFMFRVMETWSTVWICTGHDRTEYLLLYHSVYFHNIFIVIMHVMLLSPHLFSTNFTQNWTLTIDSLQDIIIYTIKFINYYKIMWSHCKDYNSLFLYV